MIALASGSGGHSGDQYYKSQMVTYPVAQCDLSMAVSKYTQPQPIDYTMIFHFYDERSVLQSCVIHSAFPDSTDCLFIKLKNHSLQDYETYLQLI